MFGPSFFGLCLEVYRPNASYSNVLIFWLVVSAMKIVERLKLAIFGLCRPNSEGYI